MKRTDLSAAKLHPTTAIAAVACCGASMRMVKSASLCGMHAANAKTNAHISVATGFAGGNSA